MPVTMFTASASAAHGSRRCTAANDAAFISPSNRRLTARMMPKSTQSPMKWSASIAGKSQIVSFTSSVA
jgi:hypothetical protein